MITNPEISFEWFQQAQSLEHGFPACLKCPDDIFVDVGQNLVVTVVSNLVAFNLFPQALPKVTPAPLCIAVRLSVHGR